MNRALDASRKMMPPQVSPANSSGKERPARRRSVSCLIASAPRERSCCSVSVIADRVVSGPEVGVARDSGARLAPAADHATVASHSLDTQPLSGSEKAAASSAPRVWLARAENAPCAALAAEGLVARDGGPGHGGPSRRRHQLIRCCSSALLAMSGLGTIHANGALGAVCQRSRNSARCLYSPVTTSPISRPTHRSSGGRGVRAADSGGDVASPDRIDAAAVEDPPDPVRNRRPDGARSCRARPRARGRVRW